MTTDKSINTATTDLLRAMTSREDAKKWWKSCMLGRKWVRTRMITFCNEAVKINTGGPRNILRTTLLKGDIVDVEKAVRTHCLGESTPNFTHITLVETYEPRWTAPITCSSERDQVIVVVQGEITLKNNKGRPRILRQDEFAILPRKTLKVPEEDHRFILETLEAGGTWLELRGTEGASKSICHDGKACTRTVCAYSHNDRDPATPYEC
jgi:hypothetical protein